MTGSAAALEDPARWIGVAIAVLGALAANPQATTHTLLGGWAAARRVGRSVRRLLARLIPSLRESVSVHLGAAAGTLKMTGGAAGRVGIGFAPDATLEQKVDVLDQRTRMLDKEVGDLQRAVRQTEQKLRDEIETAVSALRQEAAAISGAVEDLRRDIVRADASALPIIATGVILTGLAPDAERVPFAVGLAILAAAVAVACGTSYWIFRTVRST